ncbi:ADP-ribosylation [Wolfiporia cocos MD-104 SS10]|uniref:ADP-ribosylation n=1 Tax=Wolfiporia cocos (strain MD-104) TaxID=742152 RepID=A0A2H3K3A4_WOLCO|nr:ADP-ribosylation [Wolfiporia cocos MD-104 SS10]
MCSDTSRGSDTLCEYPGCRRTVWKDPDGSYSSYCGTAHRNAVASTPSAVSKQPLCKNCQKRPAYVEGSRVHDFCGIRCATEFHQTGRPSASPQSPRAPGGRGGVCGLAGCQKPVFKPTNGPPSGYCSNAHRLEAVAKGQAEACLSCGKWPKAMVDENISDFCSQKCGQDVVNKAPIILEVNRQHEAFRSVAKQFTDSWKHPTAKPTVLRVWKIFSDQDHNDDFARYRLSVERRTGLKNGHSLRRWHGTKRACQIGDDRSPQNVKVCSQQTCSVCSIIRTSFNSAHFGRRFNYGRFGPGIYTSATSSKSNDYVDELGGSPYKALLLNDVVLGKTKKEYTDQPNYTEAPAGYDSVIGEPGGDLNYDESIVYKNEAIRPLFLVIYRR